MMLTREVRRVQVLCAVLLVLVGCSEMPSPDAGTPTSCTPGTTSLDTIFASTIGPGSSGNCVLCHGQGAGQGGLFFTDAKSFYAAMVGVKSKTDPAVSRVNPGHPESSHLVFRIQPGTDLLKRMPQGGPPLSTSAVEAITGWICAGAPEPTGVMDAGLPDAGVDGGVDAGIDAGQLTITDFSPQAGVVGTHVTVTGTGFSTTAAQNVLSFAGAVATVTTATATSLEADVPLDAGSGLLALTVGTRTVMSANAFTVIPGTPVPTLTSLNPTSVPVGSGDTTVALSGMSFRPNSSVLVDGSPVMTTFVASARLDAVVPLAALSTAGTRMVSVTTVPADGGVGGGTSAALPLTVTNPAPTLTSLTPSLVASGGAAFSLTLTGTGFVASSVAELDGSPVATTFNSSTSVAAAMPSFASAGMHTIAVRNAAPGGGVSSNQTLTVQMIALPSISSLSPNPGPAGQSFTLTVTGANFTCAGAGPSVLFDGGVFPTATCAPTMLTSALPALPAGMSNVVVRNPNLDVSAGVALSLLVPNPLPVLTSLSPSMVNAGSGAQSIDVLGSQFVPASVVRVNGANRATTFVDAGLLSAALLAGDVATVGSVNLVVNSPAPGGGLSVAMPLTVNFVNPVPTVSAVAPSLVVTNSGAATVTVTGTNFVASSVANFDGAARVTTFQSATQVTMAMTAADAMTSGAHSVSVTNPAPGGGTSSTVALVVGNAVPVITGLTPCGLVAGALDTTVTIDGQNFMAGSTVQFAGNALTPTFVNAGRMMVQVPAALLATAPLNRARLVVVSNPAPGGGPSSAYTFGLAARVRDFTAHVQPIFDSVCAVSCHAATGLSGGLDLSNGAARGNLVGVPSAQCSSLTRVKACGSLPADSLIIDKLNAGQGGPFPACGGPMPALGSITNAQFLDVVDWVAQGAP